MVESEDKIVSNARVKRRKKLLENFFSLSGLQVVNFFLPFATFLYLVRVLGPEKYGLIAFAMATIQYFVIIVDYGFAMTAPRDIAEVREDKEKLSKLFASIMGAKMVLMAAGFLVLCILLLSVEKFRHEWLFYILMFGIVFDNVFFPIWFFQGMEDMKFIALRNIIIKVIFTILIFVLIKTEEDYMKVPLVNLIGYFVAAATSIYFIFHKYGISIKMPVIKDVISSLQNGFSVFIARASISLLTTVNILFLGFYRPDVEVGYYAVADRIIMLLLWLATPAFQAFYPFVVKEKQISNAWAWAKIKKFAWLAFAFYTVVFLMSNQFAYHVLGIILGGKYAQSTALFQLMTIQLPLAPLVYLLSNIVFLVFQLEKYLAPVFTIAGITNIGILLLLLGGMGRGSKEVVQLSILMQAVLLVVFWFIFRKAVPREALC